MASGKGIEAGKENNGMRSTDVVGCPGYRVWENGRIESCWQKVSDGRGFAAVMTDEWHELATWPDRKGYRRVGLWVDGTLRQLTVHRIVLEAFVGPRPAGMEARHFPDRDPAINDLANLSWAARAENAGDKASHGTVAKGSRVGTAKLSEADIPAIRGLLRQRVPQRAIARAFGVSQRAITRINTGERWQHA